MTPAILLKLMLKGPMLKMIPPMLPAMFPPMLPPPMLPMFPPMLPPAMLPPRAQTVLDSMVQVASLLHWDWTVFSQKCLSQSQ